MTRLSNLLSCCGLGLQFSGAVTLGNKPRRPLEHRLLQGDESRTAVICGSQAQYLRGWASFGALCCSSPALAASLLVHLLSCALPPPTSSRREDLMSMTRMAPCSWNLCAPLESQREAGSYARGIWPGYLVTLSTSGGSSQSMVYSSPLSI